MTTKGRKVAGTVPGPAVSDDFVSREFLLEGLEELWVVDFTEHPTLTGKLYLASLKDVFSNRIVGDSLSARPSADVACEALRHARATRDPPAPVIIHSNRGGPFRSRTLQPMPSMNGLRDSMRQVASTVDNSAKESFRAVLQKIGLDQRPVWVNREELHAAIVIWTKHSYKNRRRQRRPGKLTPVEFKSASVPAKQHLLQHLCQENQVQNHLPENQVVREDTDQRVHSSGSEDLVT